MTIDIIIWFIVGLVFLVLGAEIMVRGAARLAAAVGISSLVVGLTVVAFGTSAPELAVSVQSSLNNQAALALGNVVGSNIFNILLILGISALITPLIVDAQLVRLDVPLMIGVSLLVILFALDGSIARWEGALLFAGVLAYTGFLIRQSRRESQIPVPSEAEPQNLTQPPAAPAAPTTLQERLWFNLLLIAAGLTLLVLGARWLVQSAVVMAGAFGISELVVGLTIVAGGTSLPEVATSVIAALRGQRDIAVGNVVGSNIFNLMAVLGLTALVAPTGVPVPTSALLFDLPIMVIVAIACLPIFFTGYRIARWEGFLFLAYYILYILYLILQSGGDDITLLRAMLLYFAAPLTLITLIVTVTREFRRRTQT